MPKVASALSRIRTWNLRQVRRRRSCQLIELREPYKDARSEIRTRETP